MPGNNNIPADTLSRIEAIDKRSFFNYRNLAESQETDQKVQALLRSGTNLNLQKVFYPNEKVHIFCDVSTGKECPYI